MGVARSGRSGKSESQSGKAGRTPQAASTASGNFAGCAVPSTIIGTAGWGRLSETRLGRRGAVTITLLLGMASLPLYLHASDPLMLGLGWGLDPHAVRI